MNEVENKILARVKKMLALGNDSAASEAERDTALTMAYKLLAKYNLSISDLPADQNNEAREEQAFTVSADKWARSLAHGVANMFFCKYFFTRGKSAGRDGHHFMGRQSNVVTATYMSEYLIKSIKREATKRYKSPTSPEGRSFCVGTVDTIRRRIADMQREDNDGVPGTALALVKLHDSEKEANEKFALTVGVQTSSTKSRADNSLRSSAYHDGREHGKSVSLNQQVSASAAPKRTALK